MDGQRYTLCGLQTVKRLTTQITTGSEQGIRAEEWPELSDFNRRSNREAIATVPVEIEDTLDLETEARSSVCLVCFGPGPSGTGAYFVHRHNVQTSETMRSGENSFDIVID